VATCTAGTVLSADVSSSTAVANLQDGNNTENARQAANATSGDGVGGEVIGAVTSAGGSASIVAANTSDNVDITTGDARADNTLTTFVGQNFSACLAFGIPASQFLLSATCTATSPGAADVASSTAANVQDGNNRLNGNQTSNAATGDGVGGQVIGVVSAGAASVDASNRSVDSSVQTGDSNAANDGTIFVGQNTAACSADFPLATCTTGPVLGGALADVSGSAAVNLQDGDNAKTFTQSASATSGDGVAGQVTGVVTSAGGSASVVVANTSNDIDSTSGDSRFDNSQAAFVGQNVTGADFLTLLFGGVGGTFG
jgi:hypothetical protein